MTINIMITPLCEDKKKHFYSNRLLLLLLHKTIMVNGYIRDCLYDILEYMYKSKLFAESTSPFTHGVPKMRYSQTVQTKDL